MMLWGDMAPDEQVREIARLDHADLREEAANRLRFQMDLVQSGLRSLTIINGGALIALFTFIGSEGGARITFEPRAIWYSFAFFVAGLALTLLTTLSAYFTQVLYAESAVVQMWSKQREMLGGEGDNRHVRPFKVGKIFELTGVVCVVSAMVCFVFGAGFALSGVMAS